MIGLYHYPPTFLHRWPAGLKLLALATLSIVCIIIPSVTPLALGLGAVITLYTTFGHAFIKRLAMLRPLWPVIAAIFISMVMTTGVESAIAAVLRLLLMILLADLVTMSTPTQDMMDAIAPVFAPLRFAGLAPQRLSFAVAYTIRLAPLLLEVWQRHADAWRARTGRRPNWRIMAPYLANVLRQTSKNAEALDARGFDRLHRRAGADNNLALAQLCLFAAIIAALGLLPRIDLPIAAGVPITAQTLGVMLAGLILGARLGAYAVMLFLIVVAIGMPLLAGGRGGIGVFFGPTAGFLLGWIPGAWIAGAIGGGRSRIGDRGGKRALQLARSMAGAFTGGVLAIYVCGIAWLAWVVGMGVKAAALASLVFLPGDLIKVVIAAFIAVSVDNFACEARNP